MLTEPTTNIASPRAELPEDLRHALFGAQAIAFDWSVREGRICWDAPNPDRSDSADFGSKDRYGPFRMLLDRAALRRLKTLIEETFPQNPAFILQFPDGTGSTRHWFEMAAVRIQGADGSAEKVKGVIRNTGTGREASDQMTWLATRDDLTGHLNRMALQDELSEYIERAARNGEMHAYLVAAIDQLGIINQVHGHDAADEVIASTGKRLGQALRMSDLIGRTAGNKFGILVKLGSEGELARIVSRLHTAVNGKTVETRHGAVLATVSIGAVFTPQHAGNGTEAMRRAEEALEKAKTFGRNGFAVFAPSAHRESQRRRLIAAGDEIINALEEDRVVLAYQPIIHAKSRLRAFDECLLRIQRKDGSLVCAKDFIPAAETLGMVRMLDKRALELAIAELYRSNDLKLAINVSATTAGDRSWLISFINYVREHRKVADRLTVELTETAALHCFEETARFMTRLRDVGCRIAIDDFGAGHTSFRSLYELRFDAVKIDGMYVQNLSESPENQLFVRTLAELARNLKLETVAEWVGCEEDAALLESYGIDFFQGFYFGRPEIQPAWSRLGPVNAAA